MDDELRVAAWYQVADDVAEVFCDLLERPLRRLVTSLVADFDARRY